uniref:Uncharacterized protein n=1 Tax=Arundo donax TaxID=35708 RepID=A0A0A9G2J5_ARUDO
MCSSRPWSRGRCGRSRGRGSRGTRRACGRRRFRAHLGATSPGRARAPAPPSPSTAASPRTGSSGVPTPAAAGPRGAARPGRRRPRRRRRGWRWRSEGRSAEPWRRRTKAAAVAACLGDGASASGPPWLPRRRCGAAQPRAGCRLGVF